VNSLILRATTRLLLPLFLLFSLFLLFRGHDSPGGGFVGGLMAAAAVSLYALAFDVDAARRLLRIDSRSLVGLGLLAACGSGVLGPVMGRPFMTGVWISIPVAETRVYLGTPLLFDTGVYLAVVGVIATIVLPLVEEK